MTNRLPNCVEWARDVRAILEEPLKELWEEVNKMRPIDADKFKEKLNYLNYELYNSHPVGELSKEEKDIVSWYIYHISKMVDNMSTESAIPVEWIKGYIDSTLDEGNSQMLGFKAAIIKEMVEEWGKENGTEESIRDI